MKLLDRKAKIYMIVSLVLLVPALLINLGLKAFIEDESIRALVALEMQLSGNYLVPTLNGEAYYNKPPLFNWIIIAFSYLRGGIDEWTTRSVTLAALLGYAATLFFIVKKELRNPKLAFLAALSIITCGRVLFWDSMLGLIDITFSWVIFLLFYAIYYFHKKDKILTLFLVTYFLTGVAFLLKGLPALAFQSMSLLAFFLYKRRFWQLLGWKHILGILLLGTLLGSYYFSYAQDNDWRLLFATLFNESSKRTAVEYSFGETVLNLFTFPFEMIFHFLPWTVLVIGFFRRDFWRQLRTNSFVFFCSLMFAVNIVLYWTSVEVYPRYLLMHVPLLLIVCFYFYFNNEKSIQNKIIKWVFYVTCPLIALANLTPLFLEETAFIAYLELKVLLVVGGLLATSYLLIKTNRHHLLLLGIFLLVFRVGFDWYVIPPRSVDNRNSLLRDSSKALGEATKGKELFLWADSFKENTIYTNSFYVANERQRILRRDSLMDNARLYIVNKEQYPSVEIDTQYYLVTRKKRLSDDTPIDMLVGSLQKED